MSCGVDLGGGRVITKLWLWCRPAAAVPIRPLAWALPYAAGVVLKRQKKKKKEKKKKKILMKILRGLSPFL